jgi:hypothetical protein
MPSFPTFCAPWRPSFELFALRIMPSTFSFCPPWRPSFPLFAKRIMASLSSFCAPRHHLPTTTISDVAQSPSDINQTTPTERQIMGTNTRPHAVTLPSPPPYCFRNSKALVQGTSHDAPNIPSSTPSARNLACFSLASFSFLECPLVASR